MKYRSFVTLLILFSTVTIACDQETEQSKINNSILDHMKSLTNCKIESKIIEVVYLESISDEEALIHPKIKVGDKRVKSKITFCKNSSPYYFWVRKENKKISIVSYSSFEQPE